ncbi:MULTISPECIES: hypothetical protein [unclassified Oceanispirochaeta]|nr:MULTISPECIES: hypothetical protein [unclassified Oceanispirochaeta]MBF9015179.1 hypothetical protein [Oceanispirochaeta sp. M2]NPD71637.1 hypothetical protein [Oceanispirochaeta sp. M1]
MVLYRLPQAPEGLWPLQVLHSHDTPLRNNPLEKEGEQNISIPITV